MTTPVTTEPTPTPPTSPAFSITLSPYRWHLLLRDLEDHMQIVNRYGGDTVTLYEDIATQLLGEPVHAIHPQNPNPVYRPATPAKQAAPVGKPPRPWWAIWRTSN